MEPLSSPLHPVKKGLSPLHDFLFRAGACIAVGLIGFWYPVWVDRKNDESADSRVGFLLLGSLPFILGFALWATAGLANHTLKVFASRRGFGLGLVAGLLAACWSPILYICLGILWNVMRSRH
jgi:hypothetical protein